MFYSYTVQHIINVFFLGAKPNIDVMHYYYFHALFYHINLFYFFQDK